MFAGHIGAALAAGRVERRVDVGALVASSFLLDVVLWTLVLAGGESVAIPADFAATHQPAFVFPYSHGLLAAAIWSALAGAVVLGARSRDREGRGRAAAVVAAVVFSHWLLDALVHRPEMPLIGAGSPAVGIGLWDALPIALVVESAVLVVGTWLFLSGSGLSRGRSIALASLSALVLLFTVIGMTVAPPPPSAAAMAASSLVTIAIVCALAGWLARRSGGLASR
jgi:membrane-bound metal-dependent hydrolase YbcI (DUF457 family)